MMRTIVAALLVLASTAEIANAHERMRVPTRRKCNSCAADEICDDSTGFCLSKPLVWACGPMGGGEWKSCSGGVIDWMLQPNAPGVSEAEVRSEVNRAIDTWGSVPCSSLKFGEVAWKGGAEIKLDRSNRIYWETAAWPYGSSVVGLTKTYAKQDDALIRAFDIVFNGKSMGWRTVRCPDAGADCRALEGKADIMSAVLREFGHALGLGKSKVETALMAPGKSGAAQQWLAADDVQLLCALYPRPKSGQGDAGAACIENGDCKTGLSCLTSGVDALSICTVPCPASCANGYVCRETSTANKEACFPPIPSAPVGAAGGECNGSRCDAGLGPVNLTLTLADGSKETVCRCMASCSATKACPDNSFCKLDSGKSNGFCFEQIPDGFPCGKQVDPVRGCKASSTCFSLNGGPTTCYPRAPKDSSGQPTCDDDHLLDRSGTVCLETAPIGSQCGADTLTCHKSSICLAREDGVAFCRPGCSPDNASCAGEALCRTVKTAPMGGACVPPYVTAYACEPCSDEVVCADGLTCVGPEGSAFCRAGCNVDSECGSDTTCEQSDNAFGTPGLCSCGDTTGAVACSSDNDCADGEQCQDVEGTLRCRATGATGTTGESNTSTDKTSTGGTGKKDPSSDDTGEGCSCNSGASGWLSALIGLSVLPRRRRTAMRR